MWKIQGFSLCCPTYPSVFILLETTGHDEIINKRILQRKMITLVDSIEIFLTLIFHSSQDSSERAKKSKNGQKSNFKETQARLKNR